MAPVVTLIRHAQGLHDYRQDWTTIDPTLTDLGMRQCLAVRDDFPHHEKVTHILVSPLYRTVATAVHCFKPAIDRGVRVTAMPEVTANEADGCNQGHAPDEIIEWARSIFGGDFLDERSFRLLPSDWYEKSGLYECKESKLKLRASIARQILRRMAINAGDKSHIVVVSHWEFLPCLAEEEDGPMWKNAEWRSYAIGSDDAASLVQISP